VAKLYLYILKSRNFKTSQRSNESETERQRDTGRNTERERERGSERKRLIAREKYGFFQRTTDRLAFIDQGTYLVCAST
jgi:hypothetical protein